jgi:hypothetical protein
VVVVVVVQASNQCNFSFKKPRFKQTGEILIKLTPMKFWKQSYDKTSFVTKKPQCQPLYTMLVQSQPISFRVLIFFNEKSHILSLHEEQSDIPNLALCNESEWNSAQISQMQSI